LNTYSILTTVANEKLTPIHARMPIILPSEKHESWLSPESDLESLRGLLTSYPSGELGFHPVSKEVNLISENTNYKDLLMKITP
jgi:putative SOS response-associated peptidase YedK